MGFNSDDGDSDGDPEMTTAPSYRERLGRELLDCARGIVASEGLSALQARRLAKDVGCSVGTIYNIFGDLDGLIIEVNTLTLADLGKRLNATVAETAAAATPERLEALAHTYMAFALGNPKAWKAIFEHRLAEDRDVPAHYRADQAQLLALIEHIITPSIADGAKRRTAARALFSAVHGIISLSVDNKLSRFDRAQMEAEIHFIVSACAHGIAVSGGA